MKIPGSIGPTLIGKQIVLGVTGSIAAYKAVALLRTLLREGAIVHVVMTQSATKFVTPLTFEVLSGHPVSTDMFEAHQEMKHLSLSEQADAIVIAPATANCLAKLAHGLADDALTCIALALNPQAKMLIAPAMNGHMWLHPATQQNVQTLRDRGARFVGPEAGLLSCGYEGIGRLWPVEQIVAEVNTWLGATPELPGGTTDKSPTVNGIKGKPLVGSRGDA
ncbi:MAG: bifunctional 4'-phosphopantothenoylcysteine decarboxylase/phosphopantothenoylcysteine synthetase, partial [Nitrospirae bacterium]|nr:bifunctional 4'-phosphopantothenoylcysteine decarboxylase/phosphopantothenoylcysteine synthetase [Nitrospirota bacterium]